MRIAIVSLGSPADKSAWSGAPFYVTRELRRRYGDVHVVDTPRLDKVLQKASAAARWGLLPAREPLVCRAFGALIESRLETIQPDAVVAINAEHKVAYLAERWPVVLVSDGFFANIAGYYPKYQRLSARTLRNGDGQQRRLLDRAAGVVLSSEWAAQSAADHYRQPRSRFIVAPFGANLDAPPARAPLRSNEGPLKLLFVGYDWRRKGGDTVLDAFALLRRTLGDAELHIVGCEPPASFGLPGCFHHGRLSKADPGEAHRLDTLHRRSSFLFMPSRQEAYGLVYCDAAAFALPSIAADTGGVATVVEHGVSGLLLPSGSGPQAYAQAILDAWRCETTYETLQAGARRAFETRLNWRAWGDVMDAELRRVVVAESRARRFAFAPSPATELAPAGG